MRIRTMFAYESQLNSTAYESQADQYRGTEVRTILEALETTEATDLSQPVFLGRHSQLISPPNILHALSS